MNFDLCCGYGSWEDDYIRVDIDRKTKPDVIADVRFLPFRQGVSEGGTIIATPPCTYRSKAREWRYGFNPLGWAEGLEIAAASARAFVYLGGGRFIYEWGTNLEHMLGSKVNFTYDKADIRNATTTFYSNNKGLKRAKIPLKVRKAILESIS